MLSGPLTRAGLGLLLLCLTAAPQVLGADPAARLGTLLGPQDALLLTDPTGRTLYAHQADTRLIPASILKLLTALAAIDRLGPDGRFATDFYLTPDGDLVVKGFGDPLLISESVKDLADRLAPLLPRVRDLVLDSSYFSSHIRIPGRAVSAEPYDAPNGALCVNFNTVHFRRRAGRLESAEPQTPLLPFAVERITAAGIEAGRITFAHDNDDITRYAGHLLRFFLTEAGATFSGALRLGTAAPPVDRLVLRHRSVFPLTEVVRRMLEYSNNFIANQLLLALGANVYGPPATLAKGVAALRAYVARSWPQAALTVVEGSGLSRRNRVDARFFDAILQAFEPYHELLRREGRVYFKTGTLHGVSTRAGYIVDAQGGLNRFVVLLNTPSKRTEPLVAAMSSLLEELELEGRRKAP